jgi:hypothetical protein
MISSSDIVAYLNPDNSNSRVKVTTFSSSAWSQIIASAVAAVKMYLPQKYRRLVDGSAQGYVLTREAQGGESVFVLPLSLRPALNILVWRNLSRVYRDRRAADAETPVISNGGGTFTLATPLQAGDVAVADIRFTPTNFPDSIRKLCIEAAVIEVVRRAPTLQVDDWLRETYVHLGQTLMLALRDLAAGRLGLPEWDALEFCDEMETVYDSGPGYLYPNGW